LSGEGWVPFYDDARGTREVARIRGRTSVTQLGQDGELARVTDRWADVSFDGWVRSADLQEPVQGFGMIGLIRHINGAPAAAPASPVPVRLAADASAPVAFTLAPGAAVYTRGTAGDFDEVAIGEFAEGTRYYVPHGALAKPSR
jgi:hypothetical protein